MTLGARIQQLRKAAGLSQEQLASTIGMSRQAVSKWETDQAMPDVEKVLLLCQTFHISADELLGNDAGVQPDSALRQCVRQNLQRRCFTAGWVTALVGAVLLLAEFFSLFLLRDAAIRLDVVKDNTLGFFSDPMHYAAVAPMPTIFGVTTAILAIGAVVAVGSLILAYVSQRRK